MTQKIVLNGSLGLNTNISGTMDFPAKPWLTYCDNVFIADDFRVERCLGKELITEDVAHSLTTFKNSLVFVKNGVLTSEIGTYVLPSNDKLSYCTVQNKLFFVSAKIAGYLSANGYTINPKGTNISLNTTKKYADDFPKGTFITYGYSRIFVVSDNIIFMSEPHNILLFNLFSGSIVNKTNVTMVAPMESGFWYSDSEAIYWVSQESDGILKRTQKTNYPAISGKPEEVSLTELPLENVSGIGYACLTATGLCILGPEGLILAEKALELKNSEGQDIKLENYVGILRNNKYYLSISSEVPFGLIWNLINFSVTQQSEYLANSFAQCNGAFSGLFSDGHYKLFLKHPRVESKFAFKFSTDTKAHVRNLHVYGEFYGAICVTVTSDENIKREYTAEPRLNFEKAHEFKIPISRENGIGTYWDIEVRNLSGRYFNVSQIVVTYVTNRRLIK